MRAQRHRPARAKGGVDYREKKINAKERRASPTGGSAAAADGKTDAEESAGEGANDNTATVEPPSPRTLQHQTTIPAATARKWIAAGMRVRVRFDDPGANPGAASHTWYAGTVRSVKNRGRKIEIGYDDGAGEATDFPDGDVVVDDIKFAPPPESPAASEEERGAAGEECGHVASAGVVEEGEDENDEGGGSTNGEVEGRGAENDGSTKESAPMSADDEEGAGGTGNDDAAPVSALTADGSAHGEDGGLQQRSDGESTGGNDPAIREGGDRSNADDETCTPPVDDEEAAAKTKAAEGEGPQEPQQDGHHEGEKQPPPQCAPFNDALKAAFESYHQTHTLVRSENNPKEPLPPPFLSHGEECAVKTALAFVMARARARGKKVNGGGDGASLVASGSGGSARHRVGDLTTRPTPRAVGAPSSLLGGLLAPPPRRSASNGTVGKAKDSVAFDRKLNHVRDVLRLAVSVALPLYRGALEGAKEKVDDEGRLARSRRPCAVYDYEAAVLPSATGDKANNGWEKGHATLDGLCQHAVVRLAGLLREDALRTRNRRGKRSPMPRDNGARGGSSGRSEGEAHNDGNGSIADRSPTVVTDQSREEDGARRSKSSGDVVRGTVARLIHDDLMGNVYAHGAECRGTGSGRRGPQSSDPYLRERAERRIERIMAICHVLHRLLFVDTSCCLGTEVVSVICSALGDLYSNGYRGRKADGDCVDEMGLDDGSRSASNASDISSEGRAGKNRQDAQCKEKRQVVPSRWGSVGTGRYVHDRHERRRQAVGVVSQRSGAKRDCPREDPTQTHAQDALPLPRIGDVLAVNLLRLLEGAAAIRLHHRQQHATRGRGGGERALDHAASSAAAEVLSEIRAAFAGDEQEMLLPVHVEDAAAFYYKEKRAPEIVGGSDGMSAILLPGAKMMLRLHLFRLTNKLALYEQA